MKGALELDGAVDREHSRWSWRTAFAVVGWSVFAATAIGCGIGAFAVGGHKGNSAMALFAVTASCSAILVIMECLGHRVDDHGPFGGEDLNRMHDPFSSDEVR